MSGIKSSKFEDVDITGQNANSIKSSNLQTTTDGSASSKEVAFKEYVRSLQEGTITSGELAENPLLHGFSKDFRQNICDGKRKTIINADVDYQNNKISFNLGPAPGCTHWSPRSCILIVNLLHTISSASKTFFTDDVGPTQNYPNYLFSKFEISEKNKRNAAFFKQDRNLAVIQANKRWYNQLPVSSTKDTYDPRQNANLFYSNAKLSSNNRRANADSATAADRTNEQFTERNANFRKVFSAANTEVEFDMINLCKFFDIDYLDISVKLEITLENKMSQLFERIDKNADASTLTNVVKLNKIPKMMFASFKFNQSKITKLREIAHATGGRILTTYGDVYEVRRDLPANISELEENLTIANKKIKKIGLCITTQNSLSHTTPYDDRNIETASIDIKRIRLSGNSISERYLDIELDEYKDKRIIYEDFCQHEYNGSGSDSINSYSEFMNHDKFPTFKEYFDRTQADDNRHGHEIIIDLAKTKNSFDLPDGTPVCKDTKLNLNFWDPTPTASGTVSGKVLLIRYYFDTTIAQIYSSNNEIIDLLQSRYPDRDIGFKDFAINNGKDPQLNMGMLKTLTYY